MDIKYKSNKLMDICTKANIAERKYNKNMAEKIQLRIDQIKASNNVEDMIRFKVGGCHKLKGDRKEQYAMHLIEPYRLVFIKEGEEIQIAKIMEIVDYH